MGRQQWMALVDTLEGIAAGRIALTEGVASVVALRAALDQIDNPLFLPFVRVDSELHAFPVGPTRVLWSTAALARQDKARLEQEQHYATTIEQAIEKLLPSARQAACQVSVRNR